MSEMTVEQAIDYIKENESMKSKLASYQETCAELEFENEKLKEELELLKADYAIKINDDLLDKADKLIKKANELMKPDESMSAVEVLEFMKVKFFTDMIEVFGNTSYQELFQQYTPQEIVDKITEYEKSKDEKCICNKCTQEHCEESTGNGMCFQPKDIPDTNEPVSNSDEFKVGDWVKHIITGNTFCIYRIDESGYYINDDYKLRKININEYKHAEPPKEEPQVEWVYALYHRPQATDYFLGFCDTEKSAIETCEHYTIHENYVGCYYRKVCRKKEL